MEKNVKVFEIGGVNKEVAIANAKLNMSIAGDATQWWRNQLKKFDGVMTDAVKKEMFAEYLEKKVKGANGVGYIITLDAAVADTRERPWTIEDQKNEKGKRKYTTVYKLVDPTTNALVDTVNETKAAAKNRAKELIAEYADDLALGNEVKFHGELDCYYEKIVTEGEPLAFKAKYTPSKSQKNGRWLVFGIERA